MNQTSARLEVKTAEETVARSGFGTWDKENRDSFISKINFCCGEMHIIWIHMASKRP